MNWKRKVLDVAAPKEMRDMLKWFDGKKTILGVVIAVMPQVIDAVTQVVSATGAYAGAWTQVAGGALAIIGMLHKVLKG